MGRDRRRRKINFTLLFSCKPKNNLIEKKSQIKEGQQQKTHSI